MIIAVVVMAIALLISILANALLAHAHRSSEQKRVAAETKGNDLDRDKEDLIADAARLKAEIERLRNCEMKWRKKCRVESDMATGLHDKYSNSAQEHADTQEELALALKQASEWHKLAIEFAQIQDSDKRRSEKARLLSKLAAKVVELTDKWRRS